jgi:hypothetical protein
MLLGAGCHTKLERKLGLANRTCTHVLQLYTMVATMHVKVARIFKAMPKRLSQKQQGSPDGGMWSWLPRHTYSTTTPAA